MADEVDLRLADYRDDYLQCRDVRHHWKILGYFNANGEYKRKLMCGNCRTQAVDTITGWKTNRQYVYPDDYHLKGRVSVHVVRQEAISRTTPYDSEEALEAALKKSKRKRVS